MEAPTDVDSLHLSEEIEGIDENCSLIFELPETDPLYEKKKILLQNKGFGHKECVNFKTSSSTSWIHTTLEVMLQISRIIHLDEIELYFEGLDACSPVDFYNPRNELESLNSILSLIDISILNGSIMKKNALLDLRSATLDRIHEFGEKNRVESRTVKDYSCEKEKCLLQWGESNGVRSNLEIAYFEGAGRGALSIEDLKVGDTALEIPVSIIISEELVHESDMFHILERIDGMSSETMLLLWSMKERYNHNSKFRIYFDTLPENFNTGLSFGVDAIMALDGTLLLEEIIAAKQHLHSQYDQLFPALCNDHPDIFPPDFYTWENFLWACELWYSNSMKVVFTDGKLRTCLIPIAGFLNHSLYPHIMHYGKVDSTTNALKFPLSRPCNVGEQCYLSYGNFSSAHFVTFYGFLPQGDNHSDVIPLDIDAAEADRSEGHVTFNWSTHMVRGTWLSGSYNIFCYGLPPPLLDIMRKIQDPAVHTRTLTKERLDVEMQVLEALLSTFGAMMEKLGDSAPQERRSICWDVKLAVAYKDIQRRIVSSILTSCYSGRGLVEYEFSKFKE